MTWKSKVQKAIEKIIESPVDVLLDAPYQFFLPFLEEAHIRIRGQPPIYLLTERDPFDWAKSRIQYHPEDPICMDTKTPHPFDFFHCIDQLRPKHSTTQNSTATSLGCKHFGTQLKRLNASDQVKQVANAFLQYQDWARTKAHYTINLYDRPNWTTTSELAEELRRTMIYDMPEDKLK